jgi:hypothetical protein
VQGPKATPWKYELYAQTLRLPLARQKFHLFLDIQIQSLKNFRKISCLDLKVESRNSLKMGIAALSVQGGAEEVPK